MSQTAGFAGLGELHSLHDSVSPFHQNANAIASSVPFANDLLENYKHALQVHPLATKMITGATLATMGDAIAQSREPEDYDKRRALSFAAFDMSYRALQHNVFPLIVLACQGQFLSSILPQIIDPKYFAAMEQTLASQLGVVPFIYYPVFFALTGLVQGLSVKGAVERAKENFLPLMERNLIFWIPVQFVQFAWVEENLQIPFLCVCGLAWTFILSVIAGSTKEYSYCVTGMEGDCVLPDELFPIEEMAHNIEEAVHKIEHDIEEVVHEIEHEFEGIVHDINVALHLETDEVNGEKRTEKAKEEEEMLMKK